MAQANASGVMGSATAVQIVEPVSNALIRSYSYHKLRDNSQPRYKVVCRGSAHVSCTARTSPVWSIWRSRATPILRAAPPALVTAVSMVS
jgi:hypothetical protein